MNTLSPAITSQIFTNPQAYQLLRRQWRMIINSSQKHTLSASHHLLYCALCGKDWRRAFTPPHNVRKLANGAFDSWALFGAIRVVKSNYHHESLLAPFAGAVTVEMLREIQRLLPLPTPWEATIDEYSQGQFPFPAYQVDQD